MTTPPLNCQALATDYDGTIAHNGRVIPETLAALRQLKASGRRVILVTGREMAELKSVFPEYRVFDAIVAENGGLVDWPASGKDEVLGEPVPEPFVQEIIRREVSPYSIGRCIFATWQPHETVVLEIIQSLGIEYQIIFNKGAVMVLPSGINKSTGLAHVLNRLEISPEHVVGVGDAENDHAFLDSCAVAVAVENALPSLKERCDLVVSKDHGAGVIELINRILADDLASLGNRRPRKKIAQLQPLQAEAKLASA
jgi:hydroxymethylpyrimidine pyrophosphatase-like HAD family hydrolase